MANDHVEGMLPIPQVSELLVMLIKSHPAERRLSCCLFCIFSLMIYHIINLVCFELYFL